MLIPDIDSPFYSRVVRGVENKLRQADYSTDARKQLQFARGAGAISFGIPLAAGGWITALSLRPEMRARPSGL